MSTMNEPSAASAYERFELLAKATHDAVWDWNLRTNQVWWNERFLTLFGYQPGTIEDGSAQWIQKVHPNDRQRVHDTIYQTIDRGEPNWLGEYRFLKADGTYAYVHDRGHTLFEDGKAVRMVGAMQDITQQVTELARQQQAEQLKFVTDSALTAIGLYSIVRDDDTGDVIDLRYELINQMAQRMTGRPADELIGRTMLDVFPGTHTSGVWQRYKELATTGVPLRYQNHYTYEGYDIWYEVQGVRHGDWIVLSFLDITELKNTQLQLEALNENLLRSNESLQQFAYIASHDLQEPLRKIQSFGDLLKGGYADQLGTGIDYLNRMQTASSRMSGLIKDLLNFSRISTHRDVSAPVPLNPVVDRVLDDLALSIEEKQAILRIDALPTVQGDGSQLQQLFQNLLSNALKFHKPAVAPEIQIRSEVIASGDIPPGLKPGKLASAYHRIRVSDNGIGFDEQYSGRIFQVFQRLHTRSQYAGTGIGLAICEKVVTNHGGAITATSTLGVGSVFDIYLPAS